MTKTFKLVADGKESGDAQMEELFAEQLTELFHLFCRKQKSYGRGNISKFGEAGVLVRCSDKMERLLHLIWKHIDNPLADESIEDSWLDLGVYSQIAILCRKGKWI